MVHMLPIVEHPKGCNASLQGSIVNAHWFSSTPFIESHITTLRSLSHRIPGLTRRSISQSKSALGRGLLVRSTRASTIALKRWWPSRSSTWRRRKMRSRTFSRRSRCSASVTAPMSPNTMAHIWRYTLPLFGISGVYRQTIVRVFFLYVITASFNIDMKSLS